MPVCVRVFCKLIFSVNVSYYSCMREKQSKKKPFDSFFSRSPRNALIFIFNVKILLNVIALTHTHPSPSVEHVISRRVRWMLWRRGRTIQIGCIHERQSKFRYTTLCVFGVAFKIYVWIWCPSPTTWTKYTNNQNIATTKCHCRPDTDFYIFQFHLQRKNKKKNTIHLIFPCKSALKKWPEKSNAK